MTTKNYEIVTYGTSTADFDSDKLMNIDLQYGVLEDNHHYWDIDYEYVNNELENNVEFRKELNDTDFHTSFESSEPCELYSQLTGTSIEDLFMKFCDVEELGENFKDIYDVLREQADEAREYLENNDEIGITYLEEDYEEELFISCKFTAEENVANEVKDKLKEIENNYTKKLQSMDEKSYSYDDPAFGIKLFKINLKPDLTANEFEVNEI